MMSKNHRVVSVLLLLSMLIATFPLSVLPVAAEGDESISASSGGEKAATGLDAELKQYVGAGFDVTAGKELLKVNLKTTFTILDIKNAELYNHVRYNNYNIQDTQNFTATSALSIAQQVSNSTSVGIDGKIMAVTAGVDTAFERSSFTENTVQEFYEYYYTIIRNRSITLDLDIHEIRDYLNPKFESEMKAVKSKEDARMLMTKYGTHLITGYDLGGTLAITNYRRSSSASENIAGSMRLNEKIGAAIGAIANAGQSFSFKQEYEDHEQTGTGTSQYKVALTGGDAVQSLTIDQLFTLDPSLVNNGGYAYNAWIKSVNDGKNLEIVSISSNGGQAIPVWQLLPTTNEYNTVRRYLIQAYAEMCGDKYAEFTEKYHTLYVDLAEPAPEESEGSVTIDGFYRISQNGVVNVTSEIDSTSTYRVTPGSTVCLTYDSTARITDDVVWSVSQNAKYVTVEDARNGVFRFGTDSAAYGKPIIITVSVNGKECDTIKFNIVASPYSDGYGTEDDPYILASAADLRTLCITNSDWNSYFCMVNDIDMISEQDIDMWKALGTETHPFNGTFDGNYCTILNYGRYSSDQKYVGLFSVIGEGGTVKNLKLVNPKIELKDTSVKPELYVGMIAGWNKGTIDNCVVDETSAISGLTIKYNSQDISKKDPGKDDNSQSAAYYNKDGLQEGAVITIAGGSLAGKNTGKITASGVVSPRVNVEINAESMSEGIIAECMAGGAVGYSDTSGVYEHCYVKTYVNQKTSGSITSEVVGGNRGSFIGPYYNVNADACAGGFIGYANGGTMTECVVDVPDTIRVQHKQCTNGNLLQSKTAKVNNNNVNQSYVYAGTLIGKVTKADNDTPTCTLNNIYVRALRVVSTPVAGYTVAALTDGDGSGFIKQDAEHFRKLTTEIRLTDSILKNGLDTKWCADTDGFPVLKSFNFKNVSIDTSNIKKDFYRGEAFNLFLLPENGQNEGNNKGIEISMTSLPGTDGKSDTIYLDKYRLTYSGFKKTTVNTTGYNITVNVNGKSNTYKAKVNKCNIEYLLAEDVTGMPLYAGDEYKDRTIKLTAVLSNGERIGYVDKTLLNYVNYPAEPPTFVVNSDGKERTLRYGDNTVKVSYAGKEVDLIVNAEENALTELEKLADPTRTTYMVGEQFSTSGMQFKAHYANGKVEDVELNDLELIGENIAEGENEIIVSYTDYAHTATFKVTGINALRITSQPTKTEYFVGDRIDLSGIALQYTTDGKEYVPVDFADCSFSPKTVQKSGINTIKITYKDYTTTVDVKGRVHTEEFTVTWVTGAGSTEEIYVYGEAPAFKGATEKAADETYRYTFTGWDKTLLPVTENVTYTATYSKQFVNYTVKFFDMNQNVIASRTDYHYGDTVIPPIPPKIEGYTFAEWNMPIVPVAEDATYIAIYVPAGTATGISVVWVVDGNVTTEVYQKNDVPSYRGTTDKAADDVYTYTFTGWDNTPAPLTENTVYTAQYEKTYRNYTVSFVDGDGKTVSEKTDYHYGDAVTVPEAPVKEGYTFVGWNKAVTLVNGDATYTAVYTQESYTVSFYGHAGQLLHRDTYLYGAEVSVPEAPAVEGYTFFDWNAPISTATEDAIYIALYTPVSVTPRYTVVWLVDGSVTVEEYDEGVQPSYKGNTDKADDATYSYTFAGWDKTPGAVTKTAVYTAQYNKTDRLYTVTFLDGDGDVITESADYPYGGTVVAPTAPAKAGYTFTGWDAAVVPVTGDATYTALYAKNSYTVTFYGLHGQVIRKDACLHGASVTAPKAPAETGYTFTGWNAAVTNATEDAIYIALYTPVKEARYTVVWVVDDVVTMEEYDEDDVPSYVGSTDKADDDTYTYTFAGWDKTIESVTQHTVYTAQYEKTYRSYSVKFFNDKGGVISSKGNYHYGDTVVVPAAPAKAGYTFTGWSAAVTPVSGDATYTAVYTQDTYTVSFYSQSGQLIQQNTYLYGAEVDTPDAPEEIGYTFTGWNAPISTATKDAIYVALYAPLGSVDTVYTIVWLVDGSVTVETYASGAMPSFKGTTDKADDDTYTYTFAGWDKTPGAVTKTEVYTAQYEKNYRPYTVTFKDEKGIALSSKDDYHYGDTVVVPAAPAKAGYTFTGWSAAVTPVSGNATYTAVYAQDTYTVSFCDTDGNVIESKSYTYGETVTMPEAPHKAGYTFDRWIPGIVDVSGNTVYYALYKVDVAGIDSAVADVDKDGKVTEHDAVMLLRYVLSLADKGFKVSKEVGDVNRDGKITSDDALYIRNYCNEPSAYPLP